MRGGSGSSARTTFPGRGHRGSDPPGEPVGAAIVAAAEGYREPARVVHRDHSGVGALVPEQRGDEADGGPSGEKEDDGVALPPRPTQNILGSALVEPGVVPGGSEVVRVAAAVLGGRYEADHGRLPQTRKTAPSGTRRCMDAMLLTDDVWRRAVSPSRPQSSSTLPAGTTLSMPMSVSTTVRRALTAQSLAISSNEPPVPPTNTASGSGRSRSASGAAPSTTST